MIFAIVDGQKVEATPKSNGACPLCELPVVSKCGEVNIWHWAHSKNESCDAWHEPETSWHKNWKAIFGKENCEIVIEKDGVKHIADIHTIENVVIELQNSPIQKQTIRKRENFYGKRMIWIVNGQHFKTNFRIATSPIWEDDEYFRTHSPLAIQMGFIPPKHSADLQFSWQQPRKCWNGVQRNVFIDFGDNDLFWVTTGMGTKSGFGRRVDKERFIKKYGGDSGLLHSIVN